MSIVLEYPFKKFPDIFERDCPFYPQCTLEDFHQAIASIAISVNAEPEVQQLFATAKNTCVYSYFAYRLNELVELYSLASLEKALSLRAKRVAPEMFKKKNGDMKAPTLNELIDRSIVGNWFNLDSDEQLQKLKISLHAGRDGLRNNIAHGDAPMTGGGIEALYQAAKNINLLYS